jgi:monoamine oxidase
MSHQEQIEYALNFGSKIHPQFREEYETGFSVAWHRERYSLGGWAGFTTAQRQLYYPRLIEPDNRIYLAGDFLSYLSGWQEGAFEAAWIQVEALHKRVMQAA